MRLRLMDVDTFQFANVAQLWEEENTAFQEGGKSKYGILSHGWLREEDEVKYNELSHPGNARDKKGYFKIIQTCGLAKQENLRSVWLDTCCIDKSSSAELQESINSMYTWYEESAECYVYLKDTDLDLMPPSKVEIGQDEWFERAWTLQELVAPKTIKFYDKNWRYIGDKHGLKQQIHERTGISIKLLGNEARLEDFSIAERMSWAAGRKRAVIEDRAYSLFGLFSVSLPMLYGERENAFLRLQEEIIKTSDDHSIFAWTSMSDHHGGLLARMPKDFAASRTG
ncbi:HET-domain-containing protein [Apiospora aurea]|uniref:HET-domain-containing protein n=1 Tax=Apiospora aurea TaxID=335848 RepID=A0ABR1QRS7_9PEZI